MRKLTYGYVKCSSLFKASSFTDLKSLNCDIEFMCTFNINSQRFPSQMNSTLILQNMRWLTMLIIDLEARKINNEFYYMTGSWVSSLPHMLLQKCF